MKPRGDPLHVMMSYSLKIISKPFVVFADWTPEISNWQDIHVNWYVYYRLFSKQLIYNKHLTFFTTETSIIKYFIGWMTNNWLVIVRCKTPYMETKTDFKSCFSKNVMFTLHVCRLNCLHHKFLYLNNISLKTGLEVISNTLYCKSISI